MADSLTELMIVAAAREIRDGDVVFVGMRLPMRAFALAKRLHAPEAVGLFECGVVRDTPASQPPVTMADPPNITGASWAGSTGELMGLLAQGHVHLGMIGTAQIDRYGNLNTSYIGGYVQPQVRLPGSGGASDIASLSQRLLIIAPHEPRRFVEEVDYITSPGHGTGQGWREGAGLPAREGPRSHGGPDVVVSTLGVLRFDDEGEMVLATIHPGVTVDQVQQSTSWPLKLAGDLRETEAPSAAEREVLGELLPESHSRMVALMTKAR
jgi:glutaconate CoA-transferase, subunit B